MLRCCEAELGATNLTIEFPLCFRRPKETIKAENNDQLCVEARWRRHHSYAQKSKLLQIVCVSSSSLIRLVTVKESDLLMPSWLQVVEKNVNRR